MILITSMASNLRKFLPTSLEKYKLSRRGRKLQSSDLKIVTALPKDISERTWADILQKEETDLIIFDLREEVFDFAMDVCYSSYMEKQKALFTVHCAAQAWLKLISWNFFRHDPGEDPTAYPPSYIPKRQESWIPDELPRPSPKDTWCREDLEVVDEVSEEVPRKWPSTSSLEMPVIEDIPKEYWYRGTADGDKSTEIIEEETSSSEKIGEDSEILENVTDYVSNTYVTEGTASSASNVKAVSSQQGAGDSSTDAIATTRRSTNRKKSFSKSTLLGRSKQALPPLPPLKGGSKSFSIILPDCQPSSLRVQTQYEILPEKIDTSQEKLKRK